MLHMGDFKARWVDFWELCGGLFYSSACFVLIFGGWGVSKTDACYCKEELRLIDCSRANLMVVPNSVPLVNYTALNLTHNSLVQVNFWVLREQLPNLKMVDLRDNPFDCKGVITDCEIAVTRKTLKTTRLPSSHAGAGVSPLRPRCDFLDESF